MWVAPLIGSEKERTLEQLIESDLGLLQLV